MSYKDDFDIFVGGKSGVFKGLKVGKTNVMKNIRSLVSIKDDDEVTAMSWGGTDEKEVLIACGLKDVRSIKVYDTECNTFTCSFLCDVGEGRVTGISRYDNAILTAVESGEIKLWRFDESDQFIINAGPHVCRMRHSNANKHVIATGGRENRLQLFDLETKTQIFSEKNLPNDWLGLKMPIWISDIGFLPESNQIVTVGRHGHIRLFDPNVQRRPVAMLNKKEEAFTCLAITKREKQIIVGTGKGRMNLVDLRIPEKILNTYKGPVGGVTGVACCSSQPYVISASMDRYLRIHDIDTKALLKKIYLTTKLTCLLLRSEFVLDTNAEIGKCDSGQQSSSVNDTSDEMI